MPLNEFFSYHVNFRIKLMSQLYASLKGFLPAKFVHECNRKKFTGQQWQQ
jgi:hypothetical protein